MFKIIGGDGHEYGPVTADELRQWIADNRANGQTLAQVEGSDLWRPLSTYPEFADVLRTAAPPGGAQTLAAPRLDELLPPDRCLRVGDCLARAWRLLGRSFFPLAAACSLVWIVLTASSLTCGLVTLALGGVLYGGLAIVYLKAIRQQPVSLADVFGYIGPSFVALMLVWIVAELGSALGLLVCLVPGIYLKVAWAFAVPLAAERRLAVWPALELSRRVVSRQFLRMAVLMVIAYLPVLVLTVYQALTFSAYLNADYASPTGLDWTKLLSEWQKVMEPMAKLGLQRQLVLLFNLPFAYAVLLTAYEDLFGTGRPGPN